MGAENRALKEENNRMGYQLQEQTRQSDKLRRGKEQSEERAQQEGDQLEECQALINTLHQEAHDRNAANAAKVPAPRHRSTSWN